MYEFLKNIEKRPQPFEVYTAEDLWTDEYTGKQMLKYHLLEDVDLSSRNHKFIDRSAEWMIDYFRLDSSKSVIDFGCGPGLYTTRLAQSGANITGIDFSSNSLTYAKEQAQKHAQDITYIHNNYLEFQSNDQFDLITMIMCDFCALSPDQRKLLLSKFAKLLKEGGAVLFDVYTLGAFAKREETVLFEKNQLNQFWSPNDYYGFLHVYKYDQEKVVLDKHTICEPKRMRTVYNWLQYFSIESLTRELHDSGLRCAEILANVAGDPYDQESDEMAIVAKLSND